MHSHICFSNIYPHLPHPKCHLCSTCTVHDICADNVKQRHDSVARSYFGNRNDMFCLEVSDAAVDQSVVTICVSWPPLLSASLDICNLILLNAGVDDSGTSPPPKCGIYKNSV